MLKAYIVAMLFIGGLLTVFSGLTSKQPADLPPAEAEAFWTYISKTNPYAKWDFFPGHIGVYPGQSPHGAYLKLYGNEIAVKAARAGEPMPEAAILVKENYGEDQKQLISITPMYKKKGYNPKAGDWFWAKYGPDGSAIRAGKIDSCIECHKTAPGDYLFSYKR